MAFGCNNIETCMNCEMVSNNEGDCNEADQYVNSSLDCIAVLEANPGLSNVEHNPLDGACTTRDCYGHVTYASSSTVWNKTCRTGTLTICLTLCQCLTVIRLGIHGIHRGVFTITWVSWI